MTTDATRDSRAIATLTGVRGFAALWVVLYHLRIVFFQAYPEWTALNRIIQTGYLGLDIFALLSGFIIAYTYCERLQSPSWPSTRRYLWLRFVRTYPLHVFILGLFVSVFVLQRGWHSIVVIPYDASFLRQLFLLNGFGLEDRWEWNVVTWSLSSEWVCYLAFPLIAPHLMRIKSGVVAAVLAALTLVTTAYGLQMVAHEDFNAGLDWGLLRIGGEFFTGCWLYRIHASGFTARWPMGWLGLLAIGVSFTVLLYTDLIPIAIAGFAAVVLALAHNQAPLSLLFANRLVIYLGEISYSIYMLHWLVVFNIDKLGLGGVPLLWLPAVLVGIILIGSALTYHLVEQTTRRSLRDFSLISR